MAQVKGEYLSYEKAKIRQKDSGKNETERRESFWILAKGNES